MRAKVLADTLQRTNRERQLLTQRAAEHAIAYVKSQKSKVKSKLLFIAHEDYEEGVIGLVAGKLVEEYYLPAIVLAKRELVSKASARSISGFNIIEFIRTNSALLINAGGHPMAAGFTIDTQNIGALQEALEKLAEEQVDGEMLKRVLKIDMQIPLERVTQDFFEAIQKLGPFGMGNPEPTFMSTVVVEDVKTVGAEKKHLKLRVAPIVVKNEGTDESHPIFDAIAFGMGEWASMLKKGSTIAIVYTLSENVWNGKTTLQLKIRDIK